MEAIKSYLENMFLHLPKSPEVMRAKEELLQMMEDKYNQLRGEGRTDNEAVGQVIAEFGNLAELAGELGISREVSALEAEPSYISMSDEEVERYLENSQAASKQVAGGVGLILGGVVLLMSLQAVSEFGYLPEKVAQAIGIGGLLLLVAVAVYMFIMAGIKSGKYEDLEKKVVNTDPYLHNRVKLLKDEYLPIFGRRIATGVFLILLGVVAMVTTAILEVGGEFLLLLLVANLIAMVAIATALFITSGSKMGAYDKLLNEGDYSRRNKASNDIMEPIAGLYWLIVLGGYLTWSFLGGAWAISWIVWPISGIFFAAVSNLVTIARRNTR